MKKNGLLFRPLITLILLTTLFTSCASMESFFNGSSKKYDSAVQKWNQGEYCSSINSMIDLVQEDSEFPDSKQFIKANFQTSIDKTNELIESKENTYTESNNNLDNIYGLYEQLYTMIAKAKLIVPLAGPDNAWTWNPGFPIDYVSELENSKENAVYARISQTKQLFESENIANALSLIDATYNKFLLGNLPNADFQNTLRESFSIQIAEISKDAALIRLYSYQFDMWEQGVEILNTAKKYNTNDEEIATIITQLEKKIAEFVLSEGKELEAIGDLTSLKAAQKLYVESANKYPEIESLAVAWYNVSDKIGNINYKLAYKLERNGDVASIEAALKKYESIKNVNDNTKERVAEAVIRTKETLAELYYQKALYLASGIENDITKGDQAISFYNKAQSFIPNYKDTKQQIVKVKKLVDEIKIRPFTSIRVNTGQIYAIKQFSGSQKSTYPNNADKIGLVSFSNTPENYISLIRSNYSEQYFIKLQSSDKVWDVTNSSTISGTPICLWDNKGSDNQLFEFVNAYYNTRTVNTYYIKSRQTGKYLSSVNGFEVSITGWDEVASNNDLVWELTPYDKYQTLPENQDFLIRNPHTGHVFDISGHDAETDKNGAHVETWDYPLGAIESDYKFRFIPTTDNKAYWQSIQCQNGGRLVDLPGNGSKKSQELQLWKSSGDESQKFEFIATTDHSFVIGTTRGYAIDVNDNFLSAWNKHFGWNQQWELVYANGLKSNQTYSFPKL